MPVIEPETSRIRKVLGDTLASYTGTTTNSDLRKMLDDLISEVKRLYYNGQYVPYYTTLTTTPLAAGAEYSSGWADVGTFGFSKVAVVVLADVDGTLYIEQSQNLTDVIHTDQLTYTGGDTTNNVLMANIVARYIRIRYVNGSTAQTKFVLVRRYII